MTTTTRPRIVVLGGGYAGTMAANRLCSADVDVTLVNARPHFVHRIRLHQWITGTGTAAEDFDQVLGDRVRLVVDTVTRIDVPGARVELASGDILDYDHLIYAVGSTGTSADAIRGAAEHAFVLGEWEEAERLRAHLADLTRQETGDSATDVVTTVVGGGLTGIEMAAELAEAGRAVRLVSSGVLAPSFGARARRSARRRLQKLGVEILEERRVAAVGADTVTVVDTRVDPRIGRSAQTAEEALPSATTVIAAGFGVPGVAAASGLTTDARGRIVTDDTLTSVDDVRIVGAGDAVAPAGQAIRMSCQAANQTGPHAADVVLARLAGRQPGTLGVVFVGQCTSLGRRGAVIQATRRDDTPVDLIIPGRAAAGIKELVCRSVLWGLRWEARHPGAFPTFSGRPGPAVDHTADRVRA
ncbi:FAD-dependent oxidoreductase [Gordonia sp. ABSL11-1]|uniref:NAD(P)/FAD-dependent oxidoreductase n=1 Tax=Gordonia sp. ABSL11-1 TaxID=3053924 RepID=UPI002573E3DB|nr:FAD-dependent oxidoreductase [Gordonia sp. ABSL11-1]MDL9944426.1 FAD-dependent oxidoreductase [Gordonia sp. ABSL11-1]